MCVKYEVHISSMPSQGVPSVEFACRLSFVRFFDNWYIKQFNNFCQKNSIELFCVPRPVFFALSLVAHGMCHITSLLPFFPRQHQFAQRTGK